LRKNSIPYAISFETPDGRRRRAGEDDRKGKGNRTLMSALRDLTEGKYRTGAIAHILAREFWSRGEAPTLTAFAVAWVRASREHPRPNPEWAFLSDRTK